MRPDRVLGAPGGGRRRRDMERAGLAEKVLQWTKYLRNIHKCSNEML